MSNRRGENSQLFFILNNYVGNFPITNEPILFAEAVIKFINQNK